MFKGSVAHGNGGGSFKIAGTHAKPGNQSPPPVAGFFILSKCLGEC
jgi:hypothetical protein